MTRSRGFSLLELAVAVAAIGILAVTLLNRLHYYQEAAEKADMEYTVVSLKSVLRLRMSTMLVEGHAQEFSTLALQNPIDWLEEKPRNYRGVVASRTGAPMQPGSWYFDSDARTLVYVVDRSEHFQPDSEGQKRVRLRVTTLRNQPGSTSDNGVARTSDSVTLSLIEPYKWF